MNKLLELLTKPRLDGKPRAILCGDDQVFIIPTGEVLTPAEYEDRYAGTAHVATRISSMTLEALIEAMHPAVKAKIAGGDGVAALQAT